MVYMQVRDEDVIDHGGQHTKAKDVLDAAVAHVEEESSRRELAGAQLDHDRRSRLTQSRWPGGASGERDAHLSLGQGLVGREDIFGS